MTEVTIELKEKQVETSGKCRKFGIFTLIREEELLMYQKRLLSPLVPKRGMWKTLDICALDRASKPAHSLSLAAFSRLPRVVSQ